MGKGFKENLDEWDEFYSLCIKVGLTFILGIIVLVMELTM